MIEARRRRGLLLAGAGLLALGVVLNLPRLTGAPEVAQGMVRPIEIAPEAEAALDEEAGGLGTRHKGEEGKMGRPSTKQRSGLYAMKGPRAASASNEKKDEDVWGGLTGTEVGEAYGVGGLGMVGTGRGGGGTGQGTIGLGNVGLIGKGGGGGVGSGYGHAERMTHALPPAEGARRFIEFIKTTADPRSTFSVDVDTASYTSSRRNLLQYQQLPAADSVRIEEFINYFDYDYPSPQGDVPLAIEAEVGPCPWNAENRLVHVGLQGKDIATEDLPARNLVFLVDVSGSMHSADKLPLVKESLVALAHTLRAEDRISVVTYAGQAGVVLPPTSGAERDTIVEAIGRLDAGGGTNGEAGIKQAYALAREASIPDGVNRVLLATDGDFNVGVSSHRALVKMIENKRRSGVELSVLGYGIGHRDHTMEQLADHGNGNYTYIDGREEAHRVLVEQAGGTLVTIAKDVKLQVHFDPARVAQYRLIGYDNRRLAHRDFDDDTKDAGEIGAGHTVTALYEVQPAASPDPQRPWMTVDLRYKPPKSDTSHKLSVPIVASARALDETSDDFRFSAAVASFALKLAYPERDGVAVHEHSWDAIAGLATDSLGVDRSCRRHQLVSMVHMAARASGRVLPTEVPSCTLGEGGESPVAEPQPPVADLLVPDDSPVDRPSFTEPSVHAPPSDWTDTALEVLRLLPPLLALPLFVLAWRRPRRSSITELD